jgi:DNA polymerase-3 subunit epsilon
MDLGSCTAPCVRGAASGYDDVTSAAREALTRDPGAVVSAVEQHIEELSQRLEYERAARLRDGLSALVAGSMRAERLRSVMDTRIIATRRSAGAWDVISVVAGALTGSARVEHGVWEAARALRESWEEVPASTLVEERELVLAWLEQSDTRLLFMEGEWAQRATGAGRHVRWVDARRGDHAHITDILRDAVVA